MKIIQFTLWFLFASLLFSSAATARDLKLSVGDVPPNYLGKDRDKNEIYVRDLKREARRH